MKISASMIVKNEEKVLATALDSISGVDEIVIIDTGSTDNTIEIAKKYTDKVYSGAEYNWQDNFAYHRNQSLDRCSGDWILIIDADEHLDNSIEEIREFLESVPDDKTAVFFNTVSTNVKNTEHKSIRLFRNNRGIKWHGAAHNYLDNKSADAVDSEFTIYYGYSPAHQLDPDRTFRILKKYVEDNPDALRERYYLAREYYYKRDCETALEHFDIYIQKSEALAEIADAYMLSAYCFFNLGMFEDARESCIKAIIINPDFKEPFILMSKLNGSQKNNEKWLQFSELCTNTDVLFVRTATFTPLERNAEYYNNIFKNDYDTSRYNEIYEKIKQCVGLGQSVLDIGCGVGDLCAYFKNYMGFDFSCVAIDKAKNKHLLGRDVIKIDGTLKAFWQGDVYDKRSYKSADWYIATEVFEHVDDMKLLDNIDSGQHIIFAVPSFPDPAHIRLYTKEMVEERYKDILEIVKIYRFNWDNENDCWSLNAPETEQYILLVNAIKK